MDDKQQMDTAEAAREEGGASAEAPQPSALERLQAHVSPGREEGPAHTDPVHASQQPNGETPQATPGHSHDEGGAPLVPVRSISSPAEHGLPAAQPALPQLGQQEQQRTPGMVDAPMDEQRDAGNDPSSCQQPSATPGTQAERQHATAAAAAAAGAAAAVSSQAGAGCGTGGPVLDLIEAAVQAAAAAREASALAAAAAAAAAEPAGQPDSSEAGLQRQQSGGSARQPPSPAGVAGQAGEGARPATAGAAGVVIKLEQLDGGTGSERQGHHAQQPAGRGQHDVAGYPPPRQPQPPLQQQSERHHHQQQRQRQQLAPEAREAAGGSQSSGRPQHSQAGTGGAGGEDPAADLPPGHRPHFPHTAAGHVPQAPSNQQTPQSHARYHQPAPQQQLQQLQQQQRLPAAGPSRPSQRAPAEAARTGAHRLSQRASVPSEAGTSTLHAQSTRATASTTTATTATATGAGTAAAGARNAPGGHGDTAAGHGGAQSQVPMALVVRIAPGSGVLLPQEQVEALAAALAAQEQEEVETLASWQQAQRAEAQAKLDAQRSEVQQAAEVLGLSPEQQQQEAAAGGGAVASGGGGGRGGGGRLPAGDTVVLVEDLLQQLLPLPALPLPEAAELQKLAELSHAQGKRRKHFQQMLLQAFSGAADPAKTIAKCFEVLKGNAGAPGGFGVSGSSAAFSPQAAGAAAGRSRPRPGATPTAAPAEPQGTGLRGAGVGPYPSAPYAAAPSATAAGSAGAPGSSQLPPGAAPAASTGRPGSGGAPGASLAGARRSSDQGGMSSGAPPLPQSSRPSAGELGWQEQAAARQGPPSGLVRQLSDQSRFCGPVVRPKLEQVELPTRQAGGASQASGGSTPRGTSAAAPWQQQQHQQHQQQHRQHLQHAHQDQQHPHQHQQQPLRGVPSEGDAARSAPRQGGVQVQRGGSASGLELLADGAEELLHHHTDSRAAGPRHSGVSAARGGSVGAPAGYAAASASDAARSVRSGPGASVGPSGVRAGGAGGDASAQSSERWDAVRNALSAHEMEQLQRLQRQQEQQAPSAAPSPLQQARDRARQLQQQIAQRHQDRQQQQQQQAQAQYAQAQQAHQDRQQAQQLQQAQQQQAQQQAQQQQAQQQQAQQQQGQEHQAQAQQVQQQRARMQQVPAQEVLPPARDFTDLGAPSSKQTWRILEALVPATYPMTEDEVAVAVGCANDASFLAALHRLVDERLVERVEACYPVTDAQGNIAGLSAPFAAYSIHSDIDVLALRGTDAPGPAGGAGAPRSSASGPAGSGRPPPSPQQLHPAVQQAQPGQLRQSTPPRRAAAPASSGLSHLSAPDAPPSRAAPPAQRRSSATGANPHLHELLRGINQQQGPPDSSGDARSYGDMLGLSRARGPGGSPLHGVPASGRPAGGTSAGSAPASGGWGGAHSSSRAVTSQPGPLQGAPEQRPLGHPAGAPPGTHSSGQLGGGGMLRSGAGAGPRSSSGVAGPVAAIAALMSGRGAPARSLPTGHGGPPPPHHYRPVDGGMVDVEGPGEGPAGGARGKRPGDPLEPQQPRGPPSMRQAPSGGGQGR